jgi:hypothetical protein
VASVHSGVAKRSVRNERQVSIIDTSCVDCCTTALGKALLSESIQWLCSEERIPIVHVLLSEQLSSSSRLILFLAEHFLSRVDRIREQEVLIKYLLKKTTTVDYTSLSVLILIFLLRSSSRSIRSNTMKILQSKVKLTKDEFDELLRSVKHHENEIITDADYVCFLVSQLVQTMKFNEKKKRKLNQDQSKLIRLFKQLIDDDADLGIAVKQLLNIELLLLLKQCKHWSIFYEYRVSLDELLGQVEPTLSSPENKQLMENILHHIDYEALSHEQSQCFEMVIQIFQRSMKKSKSSTIIEMIVLTLKQVGCHSIVIACTTFLFS